MIALSWWHCISHLQDKMCWTWLHIHSVTKTIRIVLRTFVCSRCTQQHSWAGTYPTYLHSPTNTEKGRCFSVHIGFDSVSQNSWWAGGWTLSYWAPNNYPHLLASTSVIANRIINTSIYNLTRFHLHIISKLCAHTTIPTCFPKIPPYAPHGEVSCETVNLTFGHPVMEAIKICAPLSVLHAE